MEKLIFGILRYFTSNRLEPLTFAIRFYRLDVTVTAILRKGNCSL